ncbi:MAG: tRNA (adenosine(37)-N6)-threonylcarbamoyltransferase complex ATPase subunit type 1 TsaE [Gammaproteobacteria bacterium]|nr:tRNA (adenosine(37)-N6)-threonylcarbamoyltransferase complex ATPase subunit type 1 TsaE [Gammaproteobacteria bacterium]
MNCQLVELATETDTLALGASLAKRIESGLVFLEGELGSGKTTLVRGWLRALGRKGPVTSPTYTLIEPYSLNGVHILHIDLYRIEKIEELNYIGLLEQLELSHLQLVEWPEQGSEVLPSPDLVVKLTRKGEGRTANIGFFND